MIDKWVLFDYGGVIANDHIAEQEAILAKLFNVDVMAIRNAVTERSPQGRAVRLDLISEEEFWTSVAERLTGQRTLPVHYPQLTALWASTCSVRPRIEELLRACARNGANLGLATNLDRYREAHIRIVTAQIGEDVRIFSSWRLGAMKPDPKYFDKITKSIHRLSSTEASILFFDDRQTHVDAAIRAGWSAFRFTGLGAMSAQIAEFLNQPDAMVG